MDTLSVFQCGFQGDLLLVLSRFARLLLHIPQMQSLGCPSAPRHTIIVHEEPDRPQSRLDRYYQDGAGISVGRVCQCQVLDIKFVVLANNVSIGAATSSIINAELAVIRGVVQT